MSFEFEPEDWIVGLWMCPAGETELLFALYRLGGQEGPFKIQGRQRVHLDDEVWNSQDKKTWFKLDCPGGPQAILGKAHAMAYDYCRTFAGFQGLEPMKPDYVPVGGDHRKMIEEMSKREWCHVKRLTVGEPCPECNEVLEEPVKEHRCVAGRAS